MERVRRVDRFEGKRLKSPKDLAVGSDGTLWFTDPPWGRKNLSEGKELDGNWVYRLSPDDTLAAVIRDLAMPNGIALSPDGERLYVSDTGGYPQFPDAKFQGAPATLSAYRILPDGELASEPVWRVEAMCSGMCVDEHGNVYATGNTVSVWSSPMVSISSPGTTTISSTSVSVATLSRRDIESTAHGSPQLDGPLPSRPQVPIEPAIP